MKTSYSVLILIGLALSGCASAVPTDVLKPDLTETPTPSGSAAGGSDIDGSDSGVDGEPATFTWTQEHDFDWISNGTATTCDGRIWHLELTAELSIPEPQGVFTVSGSLDFEVDENGVMGEPIISVDGELVVATDTAALADEIEFDLKFIDQGRAVEITLASGDTGTIVYSDGEVEEFGVIYPGGPVITAALMPYDGCE